MWNSWAGFQQQAARMPVMQPMSMPLSTGLQHQQFQTGPTPSWQRAPGAPMTSTPQKFVVATTANDSEEFVMKLILGEYVEKGANHGKKFFQKVTSDATNCFIYYWDSRDGPSFEGWWFGREVGGNEVWSHNVNSSSTNPPMQGWKIPFAGPIRTTLTVSSKADVDAAALANAQKEKAKALLDQIRPVVEKASSVLEEGKKTAGDYSDADTLKAVDDQLGQQLSVLATHKPSIEAVNLMEVKPLLMQLRSVMAGVNSERGKIAMARPKAMRAKLEEQKVAEEKKILETLIHSVVEAVNKADDMVEKAQISSEMIEACGDDVEEAKKAVAQTEAAVKAAAQTVTQARTTINQKGMEKKNKIKSPTVLAQADEELKKFQTQLGENQAKLSKLNNVRQEWTLRSHAKTVVKELIEKLSPVEVEVDSVEEKVAEALAGPLKGSSPDKAVQSAMQQELMRVGTRLDQISRILESKRIMAKAPVALAEITKVEDRLRKSTSRLTKLKSDLQQVKERETTGGLSKDVGDKMTAADEALNNLLTLLGPYMAGVENEPFEKSMASVATSEAAAAAATKQLTAARTSLRVKEVEVRRFSAALAKQARTQLDGFKKQLEENTAKLEELKKTLTDRKRKVVSRELEARISEAEEQSQRLLRASEPFADEDRLKDLPAEEVRTEAANFAEAHTMLGAAINAAQATLMKELIANKAAELGTADAFAKSLTQFQGRLRSAQIELDKHQTVPKAVADQLKIHHAVQEARAKAEPVTEKVDKVKALIEKMQGTPEEEGAEDGGTAIKAAHTELEKAVSEAQASLKNATAFLYRHARLKPHAKEEIQKLQEDIVGGATQRLDGLMQSLRERDDRLKEAAILQEATEKVDEVDEAVNKASEVVAKLQSKKETDGETEAADETEKTTEALAEFDAAVQAALKAINAGKTFIAVKRLAAKRFIDAVVTSTSQGLAEQSTRLDKQSERLADLRKGNSDWKHSAAKREVSAQCEAAKVKVDAASEAADSLAEALKKLGEDGDPKALKSELQATGKAHHDAEEALTGARNFLREQLRSLKSTNGGASSDAMVLADFRTLLEELSPLQASLDKQKVQLNEQEESFVARRLQKAAVDLFEQLEAKLERAREVAQEFTGDKKEDTLLASVLLTQVTASLREHMKQASKSPKALFDDISAKEGSTYVEKCVAFQKELQTSESGGEKKDRLSEEQLRSAFAYMFKDVETDEKTFIDSLAPRYLCMSAVSLTDELNVEGGKTLRKFNVGDVAEGLEEPVLIEGKGLWRVKVKCADGMEGYATMSGNAGTVYFERYSEHVACQKRVEAVLKEATDSLNQTFAFLKQKAEETKNARSGPLSDVRSEFSKMRVRASKVQVEHNKLEKKVADACTNIDGLLEAERKRTQLAADQAAADAMASEATSKVNAVLVEVEKAIKEADDLSASTSTNPQSDISLEAIEEAEKNLEAAIASLTEVLEKVVKVHLESLTTSPKGPFVEVRKAIVRHRARLSPCEGKCRRYLERLQVARREVAGCAQRAARNALQMHIRADSLSPSAFFAKLAGATEVVSIDSLRTVISKSVGNELTEKQLDLGLKEYEKAGGLSKLSFLAMCQEFYKCVKDIALTDAFEVKKNTQTKRKIEVGEVVEVLEKSKDSSVGLLRVRCRAMLDLTEGFVTVRGNQGGVYMEPTVKPFLLCEEEASLCEACSSSSREVGRACAGDILEILEGPRHEPQIEVSRLRGRAAKDGKSGWITALDAQGKNVLEPCNVLVCRLQTALTDGFDVKECKALRKIDLNEFLEQLEEPREDTERKLMRVKVKAKSDGKEGWATLKGNQGTTYIEQGDAYKQCMSRLALHSKFESGSKVLRMLEVGEIFQVSDGPRTEKKEGAPLIKSRSISSGCEGWVLADKSLAAWTPSYQCVRGTELRDTADLENGTVLRPIEKGESLEALSAPTLVKAAEATGKSRFCVRVRAEKDAMVGFASVTSKQGLAVLKTKLEDS